jgi:hypothetical protein
MRDPPVRMTWQRAARFRRRTLIDGWGVSIKLRHWRRNFEKPRLYVLITKNHDFSGNFFQFALITSWTWIDTESDRWDPPVSAKLAKKILFVLTWTETHLSVQLKRQIWWVHVSTYRTSLALIGGSHLSDLVSIRVQLAISVNWKIFPEKSWFFVIKT